MPVIIDPALYMKKKGDLFWIPQKRELPTAFKLFGGTHAFFLPVLPNFFFRVYTQCRNAILTASLDTGQTSTPEKRHDLCT
jgi:hypothetical protein